MKYAITGSTGGFGASAVTHLLNKGVEPLSIVALARNKEKSINLSDKGVDVRIGNYEDKDSLLAGFKGVDKVLLVSSSEVGKRYTQHLNVINVAKEAGVKQIVYTSITNALESNNPLAPEHKSTEIALKESGLDYVILRNNWYTENFLTDVQYSNTSGIISTATQNGKVASATRSEYAEAAVNVLLGDNYNGKTFELSGDLWDFEELARAASSIYNKNIQYVSITINERKSSLLKAGMTEGMAEFYAELEDSISKNSLKIISNDLEMILKRKPLSLEDGLKRIL